jgi:hypothetical protein
MLATALDFDLPTLAAIAVEGIASTWLDSSERSTLRAEFERELAALGA